MTTVTANDSFLTAPTRGAGAGVGDGCDGMTAFLRLLFIRVCACLRKVSICCHAVTKRLSDWVNDVLTRDGLTVIAVSWSVINREVAHG